MAPLVIICCLISAFFSHFALQLANEIHLNTQQPAKYATIFVLTFPLPVLVLVCVSISVCLCVCVLNALVLDN